MIQKSLSGAVEPEEQQEVERIKNKGEDIQMLPLHEAIIEVHREYERASRASRDMAESHKKATTTVDQLSEQCTKSKPKKRNCWIGFAKQKEN